MKTDIIARITLGIAAVALVVLAAENAENMTYRSPQVQAASGATVSWEYKFIDRQLNVDFANGQVGGTAGWVEDGQPHAAPYSNDGSGLGARIKQLDAEGWELASNIVLSQHMLTNPQRNRAANGVTSNERFIFKRRK